MGPRPQLGQATAQSTAAAQGQALIAAKATDQHRSDVNVSALCAFPYTPHSRATTATLPSNLRRRRGVLGIRVRRQPPPREIHAQPVSNLLQALRNLEGQADPVGGLLLAELRLPTACCRWEECPQSRHQSCARESVNIVRGTNEQTAAGIGKHRCKLTRQVGGRLAREGLRCLGRRHKLVHLALQLRKRQQPLDIDHLSARSLAKIFGTRGTGSRQGSCGSR